MRIVQEEMLTEIGESERDEIDGCHLRSEFLSAERESGERVADAADDNQEAANDSNGPFEDEETILMGKCRGHGRW